jgi:hypothetical protein
LSKGRCNQILLNEYKEGKGISYHKDGEFYTSFAAILSLESSALILFSKDKKEICESYFLQPRSLFIFTNDAFEKYFHSIEDSKVDYIDEKCKNIKESKINLFEKLERNQTRISLTIRKSFKTIERDYSNNENEEILRRKNWWLNSINEEKRLNDEENS